MKGTVLSITAIVVVVLAFAVTRTPHWKFFMAFRAPITFYGKVVDQHGMPVADADVELHANQNAKQGKPYLQKTDAAGEFSLKGARGLTLFVVAKKEGYHRVVSEDARSGSEQNFGYGIDLGTGIHMPDKSNPVIFVLHKAGTLEKLERLGRSVKLMKKGKPYRMTLHRDDKSRAHMVELICETKNQGIAGNQKYDWHFKITVIEGGLAPRGGKFDFEAPVDGYQPSDSIQMLASEPDGVWKDNSERSYFVRFNDGVHARLKVRMITGGDHFVDLESYLNPQPGSRNLESMGRR